MVMANHKQPHIFFLFQEFLTLSIFISDTFFDIETIGGGKDGAIFTVTGIDRDTLQQEVFQVSIIAYKAHNEAFFTETNVVIIVNDVNDQRPEPLHKEYRTEIREETPLTISFDNDFGFHDQDLVSQFHLTAYLAD